MCFFDRKQLRFPGGLITYRYEIWFIHERCGEIRVVIRVITGKLLVPRQIIWDLNDHKILDQDVFSSTNSTAFSASNL
jgi:hypothetical protein